MWLGLALVALALGLLSLALLLKSGPTREVAPPPKGDAKPAHAEKSKVTTTPRAARVSRVSASQESTPVSGSISRPKGNLPLPPPSGLEDDEVTYISSRVNVDPSELRLIVPRFIEDDAAVESPGGATLFANGAFRATRGAKRERHEDAFTVLAGGVYAIADGAGGHAGGNVASRTAIDAVEATYRTGDFPRPAFVQPVPVGAEELVGAVLRAHDAVRAKAKKDPSLSGMGTTLLALKVDGERERIYLAHVGDSRCYRERNGALTLLTKDHTTVETGEDGKPKTMLARAVGFRERVDVDLSIGTVKSGDRYVLCTDGLYRALDEDAMRAILASTNDLHELAGKLVKTAEERDPRDNISLVVVEVK